MHFDPGAHLGAVTRSVTELERDGKPARGVTMERTYDTTPDDLWDTMTNPERLPRWFLPVSGDLTLGGRYQLQGNAGGTITECVPPRTLSLTWEFAGQMSWVDVRITPEGKSRSRLTLCHVCPVDEHWATYGPGATGVGWELGLAGLALHLSDAAFQPPDDAAFATSAEGRAFMAESSERWGRAAIAAGDAPEHARAAARRTAAFYTGEEAPTS